MIRLNPSFDRPVPQKANTLLKIHFGQVFKYDPEAGVVMIGMMQKRKTSVSESTESFRIINVISKESDIF